jgi:transketolase
VVRTSPIVSDSGKGGRKPMGYPADLTVESPGPVGVSGIATDGSSEIARLRAIARQVRVESVRAVARASAGHAGGSLSATDILVALYFSVLNVRPDDPRWPGRDRYVHSKGHACEALYATLALRGYFPIEELETFGSLDSRLQGHPDMTRLPALDMSSGALGVGFTASVGIALGSKLRGTPERTYVMLGDGECQEGVVWEAAFAAAQYQLDNLVAIVDFNGLQQFGWAGPEPGTRQAPWQLESLRGHWVAAGWSVDEIDGHDFEAILDAFRRARDVRGKPVVIIAHTIKGKGVSFMEDDVTWHSRVPTPEEVEQAVSELNEAL